MKRLYQTPAAHVYAAAPTTVIATSLPLGSNGTLDNNDDGEINVSTKEENASLWDNEW